MNVKDTLLTLGFFRTTTAGYWMSDNGEVIITVDGEVITYNRVEYTPQEFWDIMSK